MSGQGYPVLSKAALGRFAKLGQKKYRDREGLFIAEGLRTVREMLQSLPASGLLEALIVEEALLDRFAGLCPDRKVHLADRDVVARLAQTTSPQGVFGVFRKQPCEPFRTFGPRSFVVALDDVQDPGNVGTIIRTAAWFGADAVICSEGSSDPYNAKSVRSSAGSIYAIPHYTVRDLPGELRRLQEGGSTVIAAALEGSDYRSVESWPAHRVLVIGNEANGIGAPVLELADRLVRIPHAGAGRPKVESLNASVSAAILMAGLAFV